MKHSYLILAVAGLTACSTAKVSSAAGEVAPTIPANARSLPAGAELQATLDEPIGTADSHVGDEFTATVSHVLKARNGQVVVPAGARVYGRVTGLHSAGIGKRSVIRLDFDGLAFGDHRYPFDASVSNVSVRNRINKSEAGKKIAAGAIVGGALGTIISGAELSGLVTGGLLGAAAGTVVSLGTGDVEATIPAGTEMTLTTTKTISLRQ